MPSPPVVVLHHGLLVPGVVRMAEWGVGSFVGIDRVFSARGYLPLVTQVHPTASVARRAAQLKGMILERLGKSGRPAEPAGRVVVVAHSMGGLDARHMVAHLGMERFVSAVVTVSTPHRGSPYADWCLRQLGRVGAMRVLRALGLERWGGQRPHRRVVRRFNERTPDVPGVRYLSVTAARPFWEISPLLFQPYRVVNAAEGDNDGLVSVRSAVWADHVGTWPADHLHLLNRRLPLEFGRPTGDIRPYYAGLLDRLEGDGVLPTSAGREGARVRQSDADPPTGE